MSQETQNPTYLQLISQDEKKVKSEALKIKAQEASIEVQREIMNLNSAIAQKTSQIAAAQRQIPYNVKQEFKLTTELEELKEALEFVQGIKSARFSDVSI